MPRQCRRCHGLALRAGSQTVANCASCHGVHNILPASDPRSTVYPGNLGRTCGSCHPGAGRAFAIGPVHVRAATVTEHPVVKGIRWIYWVLIPLTLGFMLLHNAIDFFSKLVGGPVVPHSGETVTRMNLHFRVAHWLVMLSFPVLVVTGFALKFPEAWWARPILLWESRFALRGTVRRIAAVVLIGTLIYHAAHLIRSRRARAILAHLIPGREDLRDLVGLIRYNLGTDPDRPRFGKFNYAEKAEYWAFVWGSVIMTLSGFLLWFNNFTLRHFPKWVADAATAVHYYEAILATFSILIWHFYVTIFDPDVYPMDLSWLGIMGWNFCPWVRAPQSRRADRSPETILARPLRRGRLGLRKSGVQGCQVHAPSQVWSRPCQLTSPISPGIEPEQLFPEERSILLFLNLHRRRNLNPSKLNGGQ